MGVSVGDAAVARARPESFATGRSPVRFFFATFPRVDFLPAFFLFFFAGTDLRFRAVFFRRPRFLFAFSGIPDLHSVHNIQFTTPLCNFQPKE